MKAIDFSDPETIAFLTEALTAAGVHGLEISHPKGQVRIVVSGDGKASHEQRAKAGRTPAAAVAVKAPIAGTFCAFHPSRPDMARPDMGSDLPRSVSAGDILGFVRIGPVLVPVNAGCAGLLTKSLAAAEALVGFGDTLFEIEPQS